MTLLLNLKKQQEVSKLLDQKLKQPVGKGKLTTHFGKLKRNIDGLAYQQKIRENED